jgi:hypothetical protein
VWLAGGRSSWRSQTQPGQWPRNGFIRLSCSQRFPTIGAAKPYSSVGRRQYNHRSSRLYDLFIIIIFRFFFSGCEISKHTPDANAYTYIRIIILYIIINRTVAFSPRDIYLACCTAMSYIIYYIYIYFFFIPSTYVETSNVHAAIKFKICTDDYL